MEPDTRPAPPRTRLVGVGVALLLLLTAVALKPRVAAALAGYHPASRLEAIQGLRRICLVGGLMPFGLAVVALLKGLSRRPEARRPFGRGWFAVAAFCLGLAAMAWSLPYRLARQVPTGLPDLATLYALEDPAAFPPEAREAAQAAAAALRADHEDPADFRAQLLARPDRLVLRLWPLDAYKPVAQLRADRPEREGRDLSYSLAEKRVLKVAPWPRPN